jgi:hypothetical protein
MTTLNIPKPCHENWDAMTPRERGRHCGACDKTVVDVTRMRPSEGRRFLGRLRDELAAGAHVCVRAHADAAGRLLAPSATRRLLTNGLAAVLAVTVAGCHGSGPSVSQAQPAQPQTQQAQAQPIQRQAQQPAPMMGEPVAEPRSCIKGDVKDTSIPVLASPMPVETIGKLVAVPEPSRMVRHMEIDRTPEPATPVERTAVDDAPMPGAVPAKHLVQDHVAVTPRIALSAAPPEQRELMGKPVAAPVSATPRIVIQSAVAPAARDESGTPAIRAAVVIKGEAAADPAPTEKPSKVTTTDF